MMSYLYDSLFMVQYKHMYANSTLSYSIPASTGLISVAVNIPDGLYTISDLNTIFSK